MIKITTHQLRLLSWSRKKSVHSAICWSLLFLLAIGFNTILLLDEWGNIAVSGMPFPDFIREGQPEWLPAPGVIIKDSLLLTFSLMLMVSLNLGVLKKGILDKNLFAWSRDGLYLLAVLLSSTAFTWLLESIERKFDIIRVSMRLPYKALIYFVFSLISTGITYMRELYDKRRALLKALFKQHGLQKELGELFGEMEGLQLERDYLHGKLQETRVAQDHIKVGAKDDWELIRFDDILYVQGDGNGTKIQVKDKPPYISTMRMIDLHQQLPSTVFIRVHKSFIINKFKVLKRHNGYFCLTGSDKLISIGNTYEKAIDSDTHLSFLKGKINFMMNEKLSIQPYFGNS